MSGESERPHLAGVVEDRWNAAWAGRLERRGWQPTVLPHLGYAGESFVRVLARVVYAPEGYQPPDSTRAMVRRGWRNFFTVEAMDVPCVVHIGLERYAAHTDRSGNLDVRLPNPGLEPGIRDVIVEINGGRPTPAPVLVIAPEAAFGIVSDIDDTVLRTLLPRPMIAAYNTFVLQEQARTPVTGMAEWYADLLAANPGSPTVYVSTGAWNTAGTLRRFLTRNDFPLGPLLLTDWGPTNTGWFRSGPEHKRNSLTGLISDFPDIRWLLVGDDGQHDPEIYTTFAAAHPEHVQAIAIRELAMSEQVLAHGTPLSISDGAAGVTPIISARNGVGLAAAYQDLV